MNPAPPVTRTPAVKPTALRPRSLCHWHREFAPLGAQADAAGLERLGTAWLRERKFVRVEHEVDAVLHENLLNVSERPEDRDPGESPIALSGIVVDESHSAIRRPASARDQPKSECTGVRRTDDEHPARVVLRSHREPVAKPHERGSGSND